MLLLAPAAWAVQTLGHATSGTFPAGGPASAGFGGGAGGRGSRVAAGRARGFAGMAAPGGASGQAGRARRRVAPPTGGLPGGLARAAPALGARAAAAAACSAATRSR